MKFLIGFLILFLVGCAKENNTTITQEKMVDIVYDLSLASSAKNTSNKRDSIQYYVSYHDIFKKHGTDSLQFVSAQNYFRQDPEVYAAIYDSVEVRLRKELENIRASQPDEEELNDHKVIDYKFLPARNR